MSARYFAPTSHPLANAGLNEARQGRVAGALAELVGVVQGLMRLAGYSLADAVRKAIDARAPEAAWASAAAAALRLRRLPAGVIRGLVRILWTFVVRPYKVRMDPTDAARISTGVATGVADLVRGKDVDVQPLARRVVLAMDPVDVSVLARGVLRDVLDAYVRKPYVPSGGAGTMCALCGSAGGCRSRSMGGGSPDSPANGARLAALARRAIAAVNDLLRLEDPAMNVTTVARQAAGTYLRAALAGAPAGVRALVLNPVTRFAGPGFVQLGAWLARLPPVGRAASRYLARFGLGLEPGALARVLGRHAPALRAFVRGEPGADIEGLVVDVLAAAKPLGLARGALGSAVERTSTSEFCALCTSTYPTCLPRASRLTPLQRFRAAARVAQLAATRLR